METKAALAPFLTIAPTQRELGGLGYGNARTRTSIVGIGRVAGEQVAALLDAAPCRLLVSLGYAGALDPHLHPGDIVVANAYLHGASAPVPGALHTTRAAMLLRQAGISALEGPVLTVDEPLLSPRAKRRAYHGSGALVVDMEGHWIAEEATSRGIPLIGIRAVLDEAHYPLPSFIATIVADAGSAGVGSRRAGAVAPVSGQELPSAGAEIARSVARPADGRAEHPPGARSSALSRTDGEPGRTRHEEPPPRSAGADAGLLLPHAARGRLLVGGTGVQPDHGGGVRHAHALHGVGRGRPHPPRRGRHPAQTVRRRLLADVLRRAGRPEHVHRVLLRAQARRRFRPMLPTWRGRAPSSSRRAGCPGRAYSPRYGSLSSVSGTGRERRPCPRT